MVAKAIKKAKAAYGEDIVIIRYPKGPFMQAGVSDLLICLGGVFASAEAKAPHEAMYSGRNTHGVTVKQEAFLNRIDVAGGYSTSFSSVEEFMGFLETLFEQQ